MNEKSQARLDQLQGMTPAKLSALMIDSFQALRDLGEHFEQMNGSPSLKNLCNRVADLFAIVQMSSASPRVPNMKDSTDDPAYRDPPYQNEPGFSQCPACVNGRTEGGETCSLCHGYGKLPSPLGNDIKMPAAQIAEASGKSAVVEAAAKVFQVLPEGRAICSRCDGTGDGPVGMLCNECDGQGHLPIGAISKSSARVIASSEAAATPEDNALAVAVAALTTERIGKQAGQTTKAKSKNEKPAGEPLF